MKKILFFSILLACISTFSCQNAPKGGFTLSGMVKNADQLEGIFQEDMMNSTLQLAKTQFSKNGIFTISLPEQPKAGIYGLHIGKKQILFVFNGTEKAVQVEADLSELQTTEYKVYGSEDTESYLKMMSAIFAKQKGIPEIKQFVENTKNPLLGTLVCLQTQDFMTKEYIPLHQNNIKRIETAYPNSQYAKEYTALVGQIEQAGKGGAVPALVKVGSPAPDIQLPDPSGKVYTLSGLKGKIVLLDFWASWCGPCRRANPEVVSVYERYKDKGFTVFSVSLDKQKEAWQAAIKQDRLNWEYHVSDLKYWNCEPAQVYGVRGIPQQYLIDRTGKITAIIDPGQAVEPYLKKLLIPDKLSTLETIKFEKLKEWNPDNDDNAIGMEILIEKKDISKEKIIELIHQSVPSRCKKAVIKVFSSKKAWLEGESINYSSTIEYKKGYIALYVKNLSGSGAYDGFNEIRWMQEIGELEALDGSKTTL